MRFFRKLDQKINPATQKLQKQGADAKGYLETHTRRHFPGEESRSKLSRRAKTTEKIALHLKSTLVRPSIYDKAYPGSSQLLLQAIQWATPSPVYIYCWHNRIKSRWKSRKVLRKPFLTIFGNTSLRKISSSQNLHQSLLLYTLFILFLNSSDRHHFEAR